MEPDWSDVAQAVRGAEAFGTVGVALEGPDGQRWSHHGDRRFKAASVVKIPLMIEVYRRVEAGTLRLDEPHALTDADRATGSGVLLHLHAGLAPTIEDLVYLTMSISDNTATNLLIRRVGMAAVNQTIRALGMTASVLAREMKGRPAEPGEEENWATPEDYLGWSACSSTGRRLALPARPRWSRCWSGSRTAGGSADTFPRRPGCAGARRRAGSRG